MKSFIEIIVEILISNNFGFDYKNNRLLDFNIPYIDKRIKKVDNVNPKNELILIYLEDKKKYDIGFIEAINSFHVIGEMMFDDRIVHSVLNRNFTAEMCEFVLDNYIQLYKFNTIDDDIVGKIKFDNKALTYYNFTKVKDCFIVHIITILYRLKSLYESNRNVEFKEVLNIIHSNEKLMIENYRKLMLKKLNR